MNNPEIKTAESLRKEFDILYGDKVYDNSSDYKGEYIEWLVNKIISSQFPNITDEQIDTILKINFQSDRHTREMATKHLRTLFSSEF